MKSNQEWNQRYSSQEFIYGLKPNEYFKSKLQLIEKGSLLLPGEGEGRNALWAAQQGWDVTAFDQSDVAKEKASLLFESHGLKVNYRVSDVLSFNSKSSFKVVSLIFVHLPSSTRHSFYEHIQSFIEPNGYLVLESFHPDQILRNSGGPKNPDLLASMSEIKESFKNLNIIEFNTQEVDLDEGEHHKGKAIVIRLFAQKKI